MKKIVALASILCYAHLTHSQSLKDFKWLIGIWERSNIQKGTKTTETWSKIEDGYEGLGVTTKASDTIFTERLSIIKKDNDLYYVAEVSHNATPTYFKITSSARNRFICENPSHDFPKKITYKLKKHVLTAIISDDAKQIPFVFTKKK